MKNLLAAFLVAGLGTTAPAQGLVNFLNTSATLISSSGTAIQGPPGTYYFALLTAPVGTTDPALFTFSGAYGTNQATAGRFTGGVNVPIPGWYPGTTRAFMVAGWSASKGHDWNSNWVIGFGHEWYDGALGFSAISEGAAGGFDGTNNLPNLNVMLGSHGITSGFSVNLCCLGGWSGFTRQPTNQSVVLGGTAVFQATAIACPLPYYQWYFNGVPIAGAASNYYLITNVQPQHAGNYFAVLSNRWWGGGPGTYTSSSALLTVLVVPPAITAQLQPRTAELGSDTRFSVRATGDPLLGYRWVFNGSVGLTEVTTNSWLELTNVQFAQAGAYTVVVSNFAGAVTSAPAMLSVIPVVPRRLVRGLLLTAEPSSLLNIDHTPRLEPPDWQSFPTVSLTNSPQFYFDLSSPLPAQRFYRVWQAGAPSVVPSVSLPGMVPALTLTGAIGSRVEVEGINQIGPTDAWSTVDTVTLTETPQLYFDTSAIGQPARLYRLSPVP